jgi:heat shock protein HtpX
VTLQEQIRRNRIKSALLFSGFLLLYALIAFAASLWFGESAIFVVAGIAIFMVISSFWFGDDLAVALARGEQIETRDEAPELWDLVETQALAAGIRMPRLFISPDMTPNAFAAGRSEKQALLCFHKGLILSLDKEELEGVVAHEVAHIKNLDVRLMTYVAVLAGSIALISFFLSRMMFFSSSENRNPLLLLVAILAIILAPLAATIIQLAISRRREFLADAAAADLTRYPQGLASALERIALPAESARDSANGATAHMYITPVKLESSGIRGKLFSTHPPTEERVAKLMELSSGVTHEHTPYQLSQAMQKTLQAL